MRKFSKWRFVAKGMAIGFCFSGIPGLLMLGYHRAVDVCLIGTMISVIAFHEEHKLLWIEEHSSDQSSAR